MLLPIHPSRFFSRPAEPPGADAPVRPGDCVGAAIVFAVAAVVAVLLLGTDWNAILANGQRPLPEASRMMVINPLPR